MTDYMIMLVFAVILILAVAVIAWQWWDAQRFRALMKHLEDSGEYSPVPAGEIAFTGLIHNLNRNRIFKVLAHKKPEYEIFVADVNLAYRFLTPFGKLMDEQNRKFDPMDQNCTQLILRGKFRIPFPLIIEPVSNQGSIEFQALDQFRQKNNRMERLLPWEKPQFLMYSFYIAQEEMEQTLGKDILDAVITSRKAFTMDKEPCLIIFTKEYLSITYFQLETKEHLWNLIKFGKFLSTRLLVEPEENAVPE